MLSQINSNNVIKLLLFTVLFGSYLRSFPLFENYWIFGPAAMVCFIVIRLANNKMNVIDIIKNPFIIFGLWATFTSLWSNNSFYSLQRGIYFLAVVIFIIMIMKDTKFDVSIFLNSLKILFAITVITSLTALVFNLPIGWSDFGSFTAFKGMTSHKNTLGALLLFTSIGFIPFNETRKSKYYFLISVVFVIILLLLTHSRASILSYIIMISLPLYQSLIDFINQYVIILALAIVFLLLAPRIISYFIPEDNLFSTRELLWSTSAKAAISGGIFGLGYGMSDADNIIFEGTGSKIKSGIYMREKGNSYLAIIEETGLIGFALFLFPVLFSIKNSIKLHFVSKQKIPKNGILYFALCTLSLCFHALFEAWWVGVGSFQLFIFINLLVISDPLAVMNVQNRKSVDE